MKTEHLVRQDDFRKEEYQRIYLASPRGWKYVIKMRASFSFKWLRVHATIAFALSSTSSSAHHRPVLHVQRDSCYHSTETENEVERKERWQIRQAFHQSDEQSSVPANQMIDKRCHVESSWSRLRLVIPWISRQDDKNPRKNKSLVKTGFNECKKFEEDIRL